MTLFGAPKCQNCGAAPPVLYSRDLDTRERLCARCMQDVKLGWRPPLGTTTPPPTERRLSA